MRNPCCDAFTPQMFHDTKQNLSFEYRNANPSNMKNLFALLLLLTCITLKAQKPIVRIGGEVGKPYELDKGQLAQMKQVTMKVKSKDNQEFQYTGVALYDILTKAEAFPDARMSARSLTKYILVTAADGYQVVLALAEVDPSITDKTVLLATSMDGEELPANLGPFRLIVTGDKRAARSAMRVVSIDVLTAKPVN